MVLFIGVAVACEPALRAHGTLWIEWIILVAGFVLALAANGYFGELDDRVVAKVSGVDKRVIHRISVDGDVYSNCQADFFILAICLVIAVYIIAYTYVISYLPVPDTSDVIRLMPQIATGVSIFGLAFVAVRYACFLRLTLILEAVTAHFAKPPELRDTTKFHGIMPSTLDDLQQAVFRMETLYEPPGNIFVTIGIMGTFLGLAFGLSTLPLDSMMHSDFKTAVTQSVPFVRSMGLALGISTTGVIAALAAHFWRSWSGPPDSIEGLVSRARGLAEMQRQPTV
ncbi:MAG TPA: hypothetical protein VG387_08485 [Rhizomicrobium sp.]|nr:hypothetical protein [Rhizomicrobium sp.]